jgi:hypothetical protein
METQPEYLMRSEITQKIISETPQETKDKVREYGDNLAYLTRHEAEIRAIELTDEEIKSACYYLKRAKWYKERGINVNGHGDIKVRDYWAKIEAIRETTQLTK